MLKEKDETILMLEDKLFRVSSTTFFSSAKNYEPFCKKVEDDVSSPITSCFKSHTDPSFSLTAGTNFTTRRYIKEFGHKSCLHAKVRKQTHYQITQPKYSTFYIKKKKKNRHHSNMRSQCIKETLMTEERGNQN